MPTKSYPVVAILAAFMVSIAISAQASAVGISPGRVDINFVPGFNSTYKFSAIGDRDLPLKITVGGCGLTEYITPSISELGPIPNQRVFFDVTVSLPDEIETPGLHKCEVTLEEMAPEGGSSGVAAYTAASTQVWIRVPYPAKYLDVFLDAPNTNISEPLDFMLTLVSRGLENVTASSRIKVTGEGGATIANLYGPDTFVEAVSTRTVEMPWDTAGVQAGTYTAEATVEYGGDEPRVVRKEFKIGDMIVNIVNVTIPDMIKPDDIVKLGVELDSLWSNSISGAYVEMDLYDGTSIAGSSRSETFSIEPWSRKRVNIFFDTADIEPGDYDALFTVYYSNISSSLRISLTITEPFDMTYLIILVVVVAACAAAAYAYRKKRKKKVV